MARLLCLFAVALMLAAAPAGAQQSDYSQWNNPDGPAAGKERLQEFVDKLNGLIDKAEKARAADPNFLRDLRDLANGFDRPWRVRLFDDDFLDGDFTRDPSWNVVSGKYWVERGWGLRSAVEAGTAEQGGGQGSGNLSNEEKAAQIFGQILGQVLNKGKAGGGSSSGGGSAAAAEAVIIARAKISNGFAMEADMSSWSTKGRLHMAVYQGEFKGARTPGYRLAYTPGGGFELMRVSSRGVSTVETATGPYPLEDKKIHRLSWQRHPDGRMSVSVDGKAVLETSDRGFRDPFNGLAMINTGGDYIVKRITVMGTD